MADHRLRSLLLLAVVAVEAVAVVVVVLVTGATARGLLVEQMRETTAIASAGLAQRGVDVLAPAEQSADATAGLLERGVLPLDDDAALLSYLEAELAATPTVSGAYVGRADGSFVLVSHNGTSVEGGTRRKVVTMGPQGRRSTTTQLDAEGHTVSRVVEPTDTFDPRVRPWYVAARAAPGPAWTDPYVFFAADEPGVTAAAAVRAGSGEVRAVVGIDLSLRDLSAAVGATSVSPGSQALLVDTGGQLVASTRLDQVITTDADGTRRRVTAGEVSDPVLRGAIVAALGGGGEPADNVENTRVMALDVDDEPWGAAATPLSGDHPWVAAIVAPEEEFVGEVADAQRRSAAVAAGVGSAVVLLLLPLVVALSNRVDSVARRAATDPVTGLPNRRRFDELLAQHLADARRRRRPLCLATIDLDHFKPVNDTWGHRVGDEVLEAVGGRLRHGLRDGDVVARIGGDEFAAILVDTDLDQAVEVLERARSAVAQRAVRTAKGDVGTSVTIGVAEATDTDGSALVEQADAALYRAKAAGRNRVATTGEVLAPRLPDDLPW